MNKNDRMWQGLLWALLGTGVGLLLFGSLFALFNSVSVIGFLRSIFHNAELTVKILSLSQVLNIGTFYVLLRKRKPQAAKGVILMFFIMVVVTLIVKGI